ncbi:MAG: N-6 DNA methylase [Cyanobacteria bacterium]|nr:N-6 DNA methylase [Cyanobacteriota bacterium]
MFGGTFLNLDQLLDELGYAQSLNYRAASEPSQEPLTEHLFRAAKKAGVQGAYVFQTSPPEQKILPPRPAVYVAEAKTRDEAREIHQRLWNLGNAPFIVILLPNEIRVYTGFDFSLDNEQEGLVKEIKEIIDLTFESIRDQLADFRADSIDSGRIWETQSKYVTPEKRVDTHLLNNLKDLEKYLTGRELDLPIIHALIGKYVYIRYLYDRKILSGEWLAENNINLDSVLSRNATLAGLLHLTEVLENRFNGAIFPLPSNIEATLSDELVSLVASTFKGDDSISGQLHLDFEAYDFSYIPVETLSSIYEQFLRSQGTGRKVGAVYTPEPVADYLLCELEESKPLQSGMKILDPCCGSGIFLVLAYRRLIELALAKSPNNKLKPTELQRILCESLYGIERNKEACYVAEFSLILTLLSYIDPPDLHRNKQFKFPSLHDKQIFECDFFDDGSDFWEQNQKFDWIVGNPPWIELEQGSTTEELALTWINEHSEEKPVSNNRVCEAFTWRVVDLLKDDGCVGLLVHAKSLFNNSSEKYRSEFFKKHEVSRITNFSSLRKVLFDGRAKAPSATFIYSRSKRNIVKPPIIHCAPFVINQMSIFPWGSSSQKAGWLLTINDDEVQTVSHQEAEVGESLIWKVAFWGTYRDRKAIQRLRRLFPTTLDKIKEERNWFLCEGVQLRNRYEVDESTLEPIDEIRGLSRFNVKALRNSSNRFIVPETALERIPVEEKFVRKRGGKAGLNLIMAPHLVLNSTYALYSDQDFVIPSGQIGLSAPQEDADYLRALSIFRNSSIVQYYLFFTSPQLGVDRGRITLKAFEKLPVPVFSDYQISQLAQLHRDFSKREINLLLENNKDVQDELDNMVETYLAIPSSIRVLAKEFMTVRLSLNEGKSRGIAVNLPSLEALFDYGNTLRDELDIFTEGTGLRHKLVLSRSKELVVCSVEFVQSGDLNSYTPIDVSTEEAQGSSSTLFASIREKTKQRFSQWVYVQRSLRIFEDSRIYICKSPRLIDWTRTQALNDSDDIISEILSARRRLHAVV